MPWMSTLFGPLSETISSVSCRDWALAGDQMAGADKAPPAASADFKKSRRLIQTSLTVERPAEASANGVPTQFPNNFLSQLENYRCRRVARANGGNLPKKQADSAIGRAIPADAATPASPCAGLRYRRANPRSRKCLCADLPPTHAGKGSHQPSGHPTA